MGNKYFEEWPEANLILDPFIDEHFGVYMSMPTPKVIFITFLPEEKLAEVVPSEVAPKLNELARAFTTFITYLMEREGVLADIDDSFDEEQVKTVLRERFTKFFKHYKEEKGDDIKDVLKHFLGCPVILRDDY